MKKMKRTIVCVALAALTAASVFAFSGCDQTKEVINAYDIAVKNGFVGTEEEWLLSLHGANGTDGESLNIYDLYEAAKNSEQGYQGDILQFIKDYVNGDIYMLPENNDTQMIAKNVLSSVRVCCAFKQSVSWFDNNRIPKVSGSSGSGVFIDYGFNKNGGSAYLITNYHVVYDAKADTKNGISNCIYLYPYGSLSSFTVGDINKDEYLDDVNGDGVRDEKDQGDMKGYGIRATFVGGAMDYDIAVLKVEGSEYLKTSECEPVKFAKPNDLTVGEKAFAIGNANGQGISVTQGVVSVDSEYINMSALDNRDTNSDGYVDGVSFRVLRTDAAINHGNSGGGLFNAKGELIGITNAKNVENETDNMGYALPIAQVQYLVGNILSNVEKGVGGYATRAMLGVTTSIQQSKTELVDGKLVVKETVAIASYGGTSTAAKNKLLIGDVFKSMTLKDPSDRTKEKTFDINRQFEINDLLLTVRKGDKVTFTVLREGKEKQVEITFDKDEYFVKYA